MSKNDERAATNKLWLDWLSDTPSEVERTQSSQASAPIFRHGAVTPTQAREVKSPHTSQFQLPRSPSSSRSSPSLSPTPTFHPRLAARPSRWDMGGTLKIPPQTQSTYVPPHKEVPSHTPDSDAVVINLHLPQFHLPKLRVSGRKLLRLSLIILPLAILLFGGPLLIRKLNHAHGGSVATNTQSDQPAYAPLQPQDSGTVAQKVTNAQYDPTKQLYKYNDTYKGVALIVSQQPLPNDLRDNPTKLKEVANSIGANQAVTTANGTVYISTDTKLTTQRLVFASRQILVFISADGVLENADWVNYVQSLN